MIKYSYVYYQDKFLLSSNKSYIQVILYSLRYVISQQLISCIYVYILITT